MCLISYYILYKLNNYITYCYWLVNYGISFSITDPQNNETLFDVSMEFDDDGLWYIKYNINYPINENKYISLFNIHINIIFFILQ